MRQPSENPLSLNVVPAGELSALQRAEILALCSLAFEEDYTGAYRTFRDPVHVLGCLDGALVSHALWVVRWLQSGDGAAMRTAFVEAVATDPVMQGRGYAGQVMRAVQSAIADHDLGALCTGSPAFYARLGWERWRGPLAIRTNSGLLATPGETVMVLRLPRTPALDLDQPLSAEWREGDLW